jgi:uncharacterized protein with HEPN domain
MSADLADCRFCRLRAFLQSPSPWYPGFLGDAKTQSAVLHQLLIVGEAVKRLSPEFRAAHPAVPWRLIAGTRDKLIHFYEGVDLEEVWKMVTSDLPQLIRQIEPLTPPTR